MRPISGHYQEKTPSGSSNSPTLATDSDATVHLHERWEFVVYCSLWLILALQIRMVNLYVLRLPVIRLPGH